MTPLVMVLEGPDGSGKTTVAQRVQARQGGREFCRVLHNGPPPEGVTRAGLRDHYLQQLVGAVHERDVRGVSTVIDRSFLGELVYGAYRGGSLLTRGDVRYLERYAVRNGALLVCLDAPDDERLMRVVARDGKLTLPDVASGRDYRAYTSRGIRRRWVVAETVSAAASLITTKE